MESVTIIRVVAGVLFVMCWAFWSSAGKPASTNQNPPVRVQRVFVADSGCGEERYGLERTGCAGTLYRACSAGLQRFLAARLGLPCQTKPAYGTGGSRGDALSVVEDFTMEQSLHVSERGGLVKTMQER